MKFSKIFFLTVSTLLIVGCGNDKDSESSKSSEQANIEAKKIINDFAEGQRKLEEKKNSAVDNDLPPKSQFHNIDQKEFTLMSVNVTLAKLDPNSLNGNYLDVNELLRRYESLFPEEKSQVFEIYHMENKIAREDKAQPMIEKLRALAKDVPDTTNIIVPVIAENTDNLAKNEYATVSFNYDPNRNGFVGNTEWGNNNSTANREFFVPMSMEKARPILAHNYNVIGTAYLVAKQDGEYSHTYKPAHLDIELVDKENKESILKLNIDEFSGNSSNIDTF